MSNAAPWAVTAGNKFREVARSTENPTTKLLAEGLTALTDVMSASRTVPSGSVSGGVEYMTKGASSSK